MEYKLINSKEEDINYIKKAKLNTILTYATNLTEKEKLKINNYVDINVVKDLKEYKIIAINDKKVGCLLVKNIDNGVMIDEIYIDKEYRSLGIGTNIIKNILDINKNVYLWVYKDNEKAVSLYKRLGFIVVDETESRYYMKH